MHNRLDLIVFVVLLLAGCGHQSAQRGHHVLAPPSPPPASPLPDAEPGTPYWIAPVTAPPATSPVPPRDPSARIPGSTPFRLEPAFRVHQSHRDWLEEFRPLDHTVASVLRRVRLPRVISFVTRECDGTAFWDPNTSEVVLCYGTFDEVARLGGSNDLGSLLAFFVLHEIAHAATRLLALPIVGSEEDAADGFAATFLLENGGPNRLRSAIAFFRAASQRLANSMWDEHSLSAQRYYDLLCLGAGAGADPARELGGILPEERRERCRREFEQARTGWQRLLSPHASRIGDAFWKME